MSTITKRPSSFSTALISFKVSKGLVRSWTTSKLVTRSKPWPTASRKAAASAWRNRALPKPSPRRRAPATEGSKASKLSEGR